MLIIKKGKIKSPYRLHKCSECHCKFIYDVNKDIDGDYSILSLNRYVKCPNCKEYDSIDAHIFGDKVISYEDYEKYKKELGKEGDN